MGQFLTRHVYIMPFSLNENNFSIQVSYMGALNET